MRASALNALGSLLKHSNILQRKTILRDKFGVIRMNLDFLSAVSTKSRSNLVAIQDICETIILVCRTGQKYIEKSLSLEILTRLDQLLDTQQDREVECAGHCLCAIVLESGPTIIPAILPRIMPRLLKLLDTSHVSLLLYTLNSIQRCVHVANIVAEAGSIIEYFSIDVCCTLRDRSSLLACYPNAEVGDVAAVLEDSIEKFIARLELHGTQFDVFSSARIRGGYA